MLRIVRRELAGSAPYILTTKFNKTTLILSDIIFHDCYMFVQWNEDNIYAVVLASIFKLVIKLLSLSSENNIFQLQLMFNVAKSKKRTLNS